jgi:hypothetical protein
MDNPDLKFHPLADIFPLMEGRELDELVADIEKNGLQENIVIYEDKILDGRNRYLACKAAGVSYFSSTYVDADPVGFVISHNLRRRHLNESQRAMIAAKLATLRRGDNQHTEGLPIGRSSELLNVSERSIGRAREVLDKGSPELAAAVGRGEISVSAAAKIAAKSLAARNGCIPDGRLRDIEKQFVDDASCDKDVGAEAPAAPVPPESQSGSVSARDIALEDFSARAMELVRLTQNKNAERFANTSLPFKDLRELGHFFLDLANICERKCKAAHDAKLEVEVAALLGEAAS